MLGSGWGSDVYLLDNRFVARFPRTAEGAEWIEFDEAVLGLVGEFLSSSFAVPTVVGHGKAGPHFPYAFLLCSFVPGVPAGDTSAPHAEDFAVDLGRARMAISLSIPNRDVSLA